MQFSLLLVHTRGEQTPPTFRVEEQSRRWKSRYERYKCKVSYLKIVCSRPSIAKRFPLASGNLVQGFPILTMKKSIVKQGYD